MQKNIHTKESPGNMKRITVNKIQVEKPYTAVKNSQRSKIIIFREEKMKVKVGDVFIRELKTQGNIKLTIIPVVFGALGTIDKNLQKRFDELLIRVRVDII